MIETLFVDELSREDGAPNPRELDLAEQDSVSGHVVLAIP